MNFLKKRLNLLRVRILSSSFTTFTTAWCNSIIVFSFSAILLTSCEDPATQIGADLLNPTDIVSTSFTDTLTLKTSTVLLDSVTTNGADKLLVGSYIDPVFGKISAKSFFQIANVDSIKANENTILDSVVLNLGYKYFIGDTTQQQSFTIHRVTDKIGQNTGSLTKRLLESIDSKNTYFNTDNQKYDPIPLGSSGKFYARPIKLRRKVDTEFDSVFNTMSIKLNQGFGNELLGLSGKPAGSGLVNFKEYFKGMVLVPGENENAAILGFEPTNTPSSLGIIPSYIGLHYHTKDKKDTLRNYFFVSFTSNESYNNRYINITTDRTATSMAKLLKPNDAIEAQSPLSEVYVQAGTGIATKLEIPYLKNLAKEGNIAINKVDLILTPKKLITGQFPTIALNLITVNPKDTKRPYRTATGELAAIASEAGTTAQLAIYNSTQKNYVFNITSYVQSILSGKSENNGIIIAALNDYRLNRLVMDKNNIRLKVYYSKTGK